MPVTDHVIRVKMLQQGLNPDEYDELVELDEPKTTIAQSPQKEEPKTGVLRSIASNAAASFPSAMGALYGGAKGAALGSPLGPVGSVVGGLGGAVTGGILSRLAQDKAIEHLAPTGIANAYANEMQTTQAEHPVASRIGQVLGGLPAMTPSIGVAQSGIRALTKPLTGVTASAAEKGNLLNMAIGAGAPLGLNVAQYGLEDIRKNPLAVAAEMLGGAAMNKPTGLGQKLGLSPAVVEPRTGEGLKSRIESSTPVDPALVTPPKVDGLDSALTTTQEGDAVTPVDLYKQAKQEKEAVEAKLAEETRKLKEETALLKQTAGIKDEVAAPVDQPTTVTDDLRTSDLQEEVKPKPPAGWGEVDTTPEPYVSPRTKAQADFFKDELGPKRGVEVINDRIVTKPNDGTEILGSANYKERIARINPNKAALDTDAHEIFHVLYKDLYTSTKRKDKALLNRANRIVAVSDDYKNWAQDRKTRGINSSVNEYMTQITGEDTMSRLLSSDRQGHIKEWFKDFWSYQKQKFGKGGTGDVSRLMSNKLVNDAPYSETFGAGKTITPPKVTTESMGEDKLPNTQFSTTPGSTTPPAKPASIISKSRFWKPEIEKVRDIGTKEANDVADAQSKFFDDFNSIKGHIQGTPLEEIRKIAGLSGSVKDTISDVGGYLKQNNIILQNTLKKLYNAREGKVPAFTPKEQEIRKVVQKLLAEVRTMHASRPWIEKAPGEIDPNYFPHIAKWEVINALKQGLDAPRITRLKKDFVDYQTAKLLAKAGPKTTPAAAKALAEKNLDTILEGYSKKNVDIASQYGAIDKAEGLGLPESWRETNLLNALHRYTDRVARRFSYADNIESNMAAKKGLETLGQNDQVVNVMNQIQGIRPPSEQKRTAALQVIRAANLGTLTGLRDFVANFTLGMQHQQNPFQTIRVGLKALGSLKSSIADGVESGRIRHNINELEWGDSIGLGRRLSEILSDVQGRNFLERITRGTSMGIGKLTTLEFHQQLQKGNLSSAAKKWFEDFGEGTNWKSKKLSNEDLLKISGRFVDSVQGTYDPRGLPNFALEGSVAPILSLARWNIEKANNFHKHVLNPAKEGNFRPLLMSTLGMLVGGSAVTKLTEVVTGRKEKTAKLGELKAAHEAGNDIKSGLLYKTLGLASAAGYAGILSDVAKNTMDKMYAKTKPRWYNNMLFESFNNFKDNIMNLAEAVGQDGADMELVLDFVKTTVNDNLQLSRLIFSHLSSEQKEDIERSNTNRDLRTFKLLEGDDVADFSQSDYSKKFSGKDSREFKRTDDLEQAMELLPGLLDKAIDKAGDNPERLMDELSKLKRNSYQTMPNPDRNFVQFVQYYEYLKKTQGEQVADERLEDYLTQNMVNRVKSGMVP